MLSNEPCSFAKYGRGSSKFLLEDYKGAIPDLEAYLAEVKGKEMASDGILFVSMAHYALALCHMEVSENLELACDHLRKAGEFGEEEAYSMIKEYCN